MFHSEDEIRILNEDALDVIMRIEDLKITSFVAVDNFDTKNFDIDNHALLDKKLLTTNQTLDRIVRRNAEIK